MPDLEGKMKCWRTRDMHEVLISTFEKQKSGLRFEEDAEQNPWPNPVCRVPLSTGKTFAQSLIMYV